MILKLRTVDEGWVYYPIKKNIRVRPLTKEQFKFGMETNTPGRVEVSFLDNKNKTYSEYEGTLKVVTIGGYNLNGDEVIYTDLVAYLLNDDGKTIERIN